MEKISYAGYRFPPEIIDQAIWLYLRFTLSLRDVEDLLAERGVAVSYETVRRWVNHFGPMIAAGQTDPQNSDRHKRQSMILVPKHARGVA
jgi:transposase-like protein